MPGKYSVLAADDHSILREGMKILLADIEDIELVGLASNGDQILDFLQHKTADLLITDMSMPGKPMFEVLDWMQANKPWIKVLVVSMHDTPEFVMKALGFGIKGYLTKYSAKEELTKAIRCILEGETYFSNEIAQIVLKGSSKMDENKRRFSALSKRELEVLECLAEGMSSKEIGEKLFISERTVSNHRAHVLEKTEARNTADLIKLYLQFKG